MKTGERTQSHIGVSWVTVWVCWNDDVCSTAWVDVVDHLYGQRKGLVHTIEMAVYFCPIFHILVNRNLLKSSNAADTATFGTGCANQHHSCQWEDSCKNQHCDCQQVGYHCRVTIECGLYAVLTLYCCSVKLNSYVHPFTNTGSRRRWSWCAVYNHTETANVLYTIHACLQVNVTVFWSRQTVVLHSGCSFNVLQLQKGASHVHHHITANVIMHLSFVGVRHQSAHMQYSWHTGMCISMYTIPLHCVYSTEDDICIDILAHSFVLFLASRVLAKLCIIYSIMVIWRNGMLL